jgi:hypothetical protein
MCETVPRDHLRDNIIHRSYFNNAAGIKSNGKMLFEHLERTVYVIILTLTAAVIKSFKKRNKSAELLMRGTPRPACPHGFHCTTS